MSRTLYQQVYRLWLLSLLKKRGDFRTVAREVGISPSALTQSIKVLEEYFGKNLISRNKEGPQITTDGDEVLENFESVLHELSFIKKNMAKFDVPKRIVIGAYDSLALEHSPCLYQAIRSKFPQSKLIIKTGRSSELMSWLRQSILDMALVVNQDDDSEAFTCQTLYPNAFGLYVSSKLTDQEIQGLGHATLTPNPDGNPRFIARFLKKCRLTPEKITFHSDSFEVLGKMALSGKVISLLPVDVAKYYKDELQQLEVDSELSHKVQLFSRATLSEEIQETVLNCFKEVD